MAPFLFGGLMALVVTGFVGIFMPFNRTIDLIYAIIGCLIFSGYIVYDTYTINKRLSPDEYIMGAISLYLEYATFTFFPWNSTERSPFHSFINLCKLPSMPSLRISTNILDSHQHPKATQQPSRTLNLGAFVLHLAFIADLSSFFCKIYSRCYFVHYLCAIEFSYCFE